jgi:glutamate carboxypeptidase
VKTARKGVGDFRLQVTGVAAHPGLDFDKGQNAILELAQQVERVSAFTDPGRGLTVSAGFITGGSPPANVIPAEAEAVVDVRILRADDRAEVEQKFKALRPFNPNCRLQVSGGITRPPMERTAAIARLYENAKGIAHEIGFELGEVAVGGGSDGNFTAALGVPSLDGLGPVGEGAHAVHESVNVEWLPKRAALLAGLIERI